MQSHRRQRPNLLQHTTTLSRITTSTNNRSILPHIHTTTQSQRSIITNRQQTYRNITTMGTRITITNRRHDINRHQHQIRTTNVNLTTAHSSQVRASLTTLTNRTTNTTVSHRTKFTSNPNSNIAGMRTSHLLPTSPIRSPAISVRQRRTNTISIYPTHSYKPNQHNTKFTRRKLQK